MFKHLKVHRPLVFVDIETTGIDPSRDRIVVIAMIRFEPSSDVRSLNVRLNPECPIPLAASAVHGILDEHVASSPTFAKKARKIANFISEGDLAGFGIARFDVPFLVAEFERAGWSFPLRRRKVVDALTLFHRVEPRNLAAAMRIFCNRELRQAHRAASDVEASAAVLDAILGQHRDIPRTVSKLHKLLVPVDLQGWLQRENGVLYLARGKYKGTSLAEIARRDPSYLAWLRSIVLPDARRLIKKTERKVSRRNDD